MLLEKLAILSDAQAITTSAASTHQYDLGPAGISGYSLGNEKALCAVFTCDESFDGTGTLSFAIRTSASSNMGSPVTLVTSQAIDADTLILINAFLLVLPIPSRCLRYIDFYYTASQTNSTGKITGELALSDDTGAF